MKKIIIAIDGYASTGKSTLAKQLAKKLGYTYIDTGAMYRAVALYAMENDCIKNEVIDKKKLIGSLDKILLKFAFNPTLGFSEMYLNGKNVESQIRSLKVSQWVSQIASIASVRTKLVTLQKSMGKNKGIVMDGRDIGTVVFPNAKLKLFITASVEKRANRRHKELNDKGIAVSLNNVLENVKKRDHIDQTRSASPLKKATDAIVIDNSNLSIKEQFDKVYELVIQKIF